MEEATLELWSPVHAFTQDERESLGEVVVSEDEALDWISQGYALSAGDWLTDGEWLDTEYDVKFFFE